MVLGLVLVAVTVAWQWSRHNRARLADVRFAPIETVAAATDSPPASATLLLGPSKAYWLKTCDDKLGPMHVTVHTQETPLLFSNDRSVDQLTAEAPPYDRAARVLGKTYATLAARFEVTTHYMALPTQSWC
jgi:hypothetical protein